jgi:D-alanyl-lipoteichoic acid acyltransferase DltB (MBOAT superfamily)
LNVIGNLGVLFFYKYFDFAGGLINGIYRIFDVPPVVPTLHVVLPLGLSFYMFQALGYTFDVFSGKLKAEKHIGFFSLFVAFFPQLVAGPIQRAENLLTQLRRDHPFNYETFIPGFQLMIWGLFKKLVIAERLAICVNEVYDNLPGHTGLSLLLATYFFTFQIYCDFSGYSDIAIGCAKMLGFDLTKNFDRPYFSASIPEFWRRWHMSLMSWFKDYLYIPLGGGRRGEIRKHLNQFIVFFLSGLWHGANLTFVFWGVYHAALQILSNLTFPIRQRIFNSLGISSRIVRPLGTFTTFCFISFGWIFFRANNTRDLIYIMHNLPKGILNLSTIHIPVASEDVIISFLSIAFLLCVEFVQSKERFSNVFRESSIFVRSCSTVTLIFGLFMFGVFEEQPFLYFQF